MCLADRPCVHQHCSHQAAGSLHLRDGLSCLTALMRRLCVWVVGEAWSQPASDASCCLSGSGCLLAHVVCCCCVHVCVSLVPIRPPMIPCCKPGCDGMCWRVSCVAVAFCIASAPGPSVAEGGKTVHVLSDQGACVGCGAVLQARLVVLSEKLAFSGMCARSRSFTACLVCSDALWLAALSAVARCVQHVL